MASDRRAHGPWIHARLRYKGRNVHAELFAQALEHAFVSIHSQPPRLGPPFFREVLVG